MHFTCSLHVLLCKECSWLKEHCFPQTLPMQLTCKNEVQARPCWAVAGVLLVLEIIHLSAASCCPCCGDQVCLVSYHSHCTWMCSLALGCLLRVNESGVLAGVSFDYKSRLNNICGGSNITDYLVKEYSDVYQRARPALPGYRGRYPAKVRSPDEPLSHTVTLRTGETVPLPLGNNSRSSVARTQWRLHCTTSSGLSAHGSMGVETTASRGQRHS